MKITSEMLEQFEETQDILEGTGYDILNCSDSIRSTVMQLAAALNEMSVFEKENAELPLAKLYDCLEELSTSVENISMSAHVNEATLEKQHEIYDELKESFYK